MPVIHTHSYCQLTLAARAPLATNRLRSWRVSRCAVRRTPGDPPQGMQGTPAAPTRAPSGSCTSSPTVAAAHALGDLASRPTRGRTSFTASAHARGFLLPTASAAVAGYPPPVPRRRRIPGTIVWAVRTQLPAAQRVGSIDAPRQRPHFSIFPRADRSHRKTITLRAAHRAPASAASGERPHFFPVSKKVGPIGPIHTSRYIGSSTSGCKPSAVFCILY